MKRANYKFSIADNGLVVKCKNRTAFMKLWYFCNENLKTSQWNCYVQHVRDSAKDYTIILFALN